MRALLFTTAATKDFQSQWNNKTCFSSSMKHGNTVHLRLLLFSFLFFFCDYFCTFVAVGERLLVLAPPRLQDVWEPSQSIPTTTTLNATATDRPGEPLDGLAHLAVLGTFTVMTNQSGLKPGDPWKTKWLQISKRREKKKLHFKKILCLRKS